MDNFTSNGTENGLSDAQKLLHRLTYILAFVMLASVVLGGVGNLISVYIFTRPNMRSPVNILLAGLSANDLVLLILVVPVFVLGAMPIWSGRYQFTSFQAYMLQYIYPWTMVSQTSSVFTMVLITFERWVACCKPLKAQIWCTTVKSKTALFCVYIFAFLYNLCRFWEYGIAYNNGHARPNRLLRDFDNNRPYMFGYYTACYLVTHFVVPFTLILCLNVHAACTIIKMRKQRRHLTRIERGEHKTTIMMFVVIVIFATCNTLPFIMNFLEAATPDLFRNEDTFVVSYVLNDISNLLVVLNSATNAFIYYIFSQKYRQLFHLLLYDCSGHGALYAQPRRDSMALLAVPTLRTNLRSQSSSALIQRTRRTASCAIDLNKPPPKLMNKKTSLSLTVTPTTSFRLGGEKAGWWSRYSHKRWFGRSSPSPNALSDTVDDGSEVSRNGRLEQEKMELIMEHESHENKKDALTAANGGPGRPTTHDKEEED